MDDVFIRFSSVLDEERCSVNINDSTYFSDRLIVTERSLGIDLNNFITLKALHNLIKVEVSFYGNSVPDEEFGPQMRLVKIDTVIDVRKGNKVLIEARIKSINISQHRKKIKRY